MPINPIPPKAVRMDEIVRFVRVDDQLIALIPHIRAFWKSPSASGYHLNPLACIHAATIVPNPGFKMLRIRIIYAAAFEFKRPKAS